MTESTQTPALSRTDAASCPDCSKLLAFAELDEMIVAGVASPGQMTQHDELARELSGEKSNGEAVAAVLARQLAEARHQGAVTSLLEVKADELIERLRQDFSRETLAKDRGLAILPSGRKVSVRNVLDFERWSETANVRYFGGGFVLLSESADIAALDAALSNVGVSVNAPTIAGEDRDGDGRTGE